MLCRLSQVSPIIPLRNRVTPTQNSFHYKKKNKQKKMRGLFVFFTLTASFFFRNQRYAFYQSLNFDTNCSMLIHFYTRLFANKIINVAFKSYNKRLFNGTFNH